MCRFDSPLAHHTAVLADYAYTWAFHNFLWYFLGLSAVLVNKDVLTPGKTATTTTSKHAVKTVRSSILKQAIVLSKLLSVV